MAPEMRSTAYCANVHCCGQEGGDGRKEVVASMAHVTVGNGERGNKKCRPFIFK